MLGLKLIHVNKRGARQQAYFDPELTQMYVNQCHMASLGHNKLMFDVACRWESRQGSAQVI